MFFCCENNSWEADWDVSVQSSWGCECTLILTYTASIGSQYMVYIIIFPFFSVVISQLNYNYVIEGAKLLPGLLNPAAPHMCGDNWFNHTIISYSLFAYTLYLPATLLGAPIASPFYWFKGALLEPQSYLMTWIQQYK